MYGKVFVLLLVLTLRSQAQGNEEIKFEKKWNDRELSKQSKDKSYDGLRKASVLLFVCRSNFLVHCEQFDTKLCVISPKLWNNTFIVSSSSKVFKDAWVGKIFWKSRHCLSFKEKVLPDVSFVTCITRTCTTDGLIRTTKTKLCKKYLKTFFQSLKFILLKRYKLTSNSASLKKEDILFLFFNTRNKDEVTNSNCLWKCLCSKTHLRKKRKIRAITRKLTKPEVKNVTKISSVKPVLKDKSPVDLKVTDSNKNISANSFTKKTSLKPVTANKVKINTDTSRKLSVTNARQLAKRTNDTEDFSTDNKGNVTLLRKLRKIKSMADLKVVADEYRLNDTMILELKRELLLKYSKHPQWAFGCVVFVILLLLCAVHYSRICRNCNKDVVIIDHKEVHYVYVNDLVKKRTKVLPHLKSLLGKIKKDKNRHSNRRSYNTENFTSESENNEKHNSKSDVLSRKRGKSKRNVFSVLGKVFSSSNKKQRKLDKDNKDTLPLLEEEDSEDELYDIDDYSKYPNNSQDIDSSHDHQRETNNAKNVVTKRTVTSLAEDNEHSLQTETNSDRTENYIDVKTYHTAAGKSQNSMKNSNDLSAVKEI